jgi:hypothetical protein
VTDVKMLFKLSLKKVSKTTNILSVWPINCIHSKRFCPENVIQFSISNFRRVVNVVFFLLGQSRILNFKFLCFGTLSLSTLSVHLHRWCKLEGL